jgi:hypothetical protein
MTIVGANVALPNRPRSLLRFLAPWLASYLVPCLVAWTVVTVVALAFPPNSDNPTLFPHVAIAVSIFLWPAGLALTQWMLMRRYLPKAHVWALAAFAGALLERVSAMFVYQAIVRTITSLPYIILILQRLQPLVGGASALDLLAFFSMALCQGAAWSVPSAFLLPGTRSTRVVWAITLTLTIFAVSMMDRSLAQELETQFLGSYPKLEYLIGDRLRLAAAYALPALLGWLILSLVSGSLMYWNLRRGSAAGINQVYASFD